MATPHGSPSSVRVPSNCCSWRQPYRELPRRPTEARGSRRNVSSCSRPEVASGDDGSPADRSRGVRLPAVRGRVPDRPGPERLWLAFGPGSPWRGLRTSPRASMEAASFSPVMSRAPGSFPSSPQLIPRRGAPCGSGPRRVMSQGFLRERFDRLQATTNGMTILKQNHAGHAPPRCSAALSEGAAWPARSTGMSRRRTSSRTCSTSVPASCLPTCRPCVGSSVTVAASATSKRSCSRRDEATSRTTPSPLSRPPSGAPPSDIHPHHRRPARRRGARARRRRARSARAAVPGALLGDHRLSEGRPASQRSAGARHARLALLCACVEAPRQGIPGRSEQSSSRDPVVQLSSPARVEHALDEGRRARGIRRSSRRRRAGSRAIYGLREVLIDPTLQRLQGGRARRRVDLNGPYRSGPARRTRLTRR